MDRNWIETCGCGAETRAVNLEWVTKKADPACTAPHPHNRLDGTERRPGVKTELGWCGCGDTERVDELMLTYLRAIAHEDFDEGWAAVKAMDPDVAMLVAYMADDLGWTEHGSALPWAWLTDSGRLVLTRLAASSVSGSGS